MMSIVIYSQETLDQKTKIENFLSKTGIITKYEDYKLPNIKLGIGLGFAQSRIRKISISNEYHLFLQISVTEKNNIKTASIAFEDLTEIQRALEILSKQAPNDLDEEIEYIENKFVTEDGFKVGYYVSKNRINWFLKLEDRGLSIYTRNPEVFIEAFNLAKDKMNLLKK